MIVTAAGPALTGFNRMSPAQAHPAASPIADFSAFIENLGAQAVGGLKEAEAQSIAALSGKGSAREVVEAVMSAEHSLQIAVGVRDKIVSAYLELSRMAI